ncbi:hypothetical protein IQ238_19630 [Pleurocapsales cyanobacterium LEGE 06147]|nr:hypothetical protein [Pleurocapsales cyanobacterium LEGE 06147]
MPNLPLDPAFYPLLIFHSFTGGLAALLAKQKGYNLLLWLILGVIGGTFSLMAVLAMKEKAISNK